MDFNLKKCFRIRKSTPSWSSNFKTAQEKIKNSLFIINPTIMRLQEVWHEYSDTRLFDIEPVLTKGGAFELKTFKTMLSQKFEKAHEKIMTKLVLLR
jgi:hypothetical protein